MQLAELVETAHRIAKEHGWWDDEKYNFGEKLALMHSELSEALEEHRAGHAPYEIYFQRDGIRYDSQVMHESAPPWNNPEERAQYLASFKPEGVPIELADVIIRIADLCGREGINLEQAIRLKLRYNEGRPYRHGGKAC